MMAKPDVLAFVQHLKDVWRLDRDASRTRFAYQWRLVDGGFRLIQWLFTVGVIAAVYRKTHSGVLLLVGIILFLSIQWVIVSPVIFLLSRGSEGELKFFALPTGRRLAVAFVFTACLFLSMAVVNAISNAIVAAYISFLTTAK